MRLLICGGRDWCNPDVLPEGYKHIAETMRDESFEFLDALHADLGFTVVIEGEARGADTIGREWAESRGIPVEKYPADWKRFGRAAGPIRNKQMLTEGKPDCVVAFPGGSGTNNMKTQARYAKVEVIEYDG